MAISKLPAGAEDITFGTGTEQQERNGKLLTITQVNGSHIPYDATQSVNQKMDAVDSKFQSVRNDLDTHKSDVNPHSISAAMIGSFEKIEHVVISNGQIDSGKPIILDQNGRLDPSVVGYGLYPVGYFTPTSSDEYPDTTGEQVGAYWEVDGVDATLGYTITTGDLAGVTVHNKDYMINGSQGWTVAQDESSMYYKLDGSVAIMADFQAGNKKLVNIAQADTAGDSVEYQQWIDYNSNQDTYITEAKNAADLAQQTINDHSADTNNPHGVTAEQANAEPFIQPGTLGQIYTTVDDGVGGATKSWADAYDGSDRVPLDGSQPMIGELNAPSVYLTSDLKLEDSAGNPVVVTGDVMATFGIESGSNENGNYIKYPDGTLICYGTNEDILCAQTSGSVFYGNVDNRVFPVPFIDNNIIVSGSGEPASGSFGLIWITSRNITQNDFTLTAIASYSDTTVGNVKWQSIGRWK